MNKQHGYTTLILLFLLYCEPVLSSSARNYNVLIILVDDLRHLTDKNVELPNIKKMASKGVNFKNAFCQQALCAPSRNSILTGRRPDSLRLYDFYNYWRDTIGNFTTIPQYFKENGYDTYSVGKVFHPGISSNYTDDYPYSWSFKPYHPPTERYMNSPVCKDRNAKLHSNLICPVNVKDQPGGTLPDVQSLEEAASILKMNHSKPFLLAVGFHKPHIPLKFPRRYLKKVPMSSVDPPAVPYIPTAMPTVAYHPWTDLRSRDDIARLNISFPFGTMPPKWTLRIRQSYYAAAVYVDHLIGVLMSYVDLRKTVVVLTSDHGWSLGENGLWAKYSNFDVALKVPLIFLAPDLIQKTIDNPVELLDIFPTLVALSGIQSSIPKCGKMDPRVLCFEGQNLVPLMRGKRKEYNKNIAVSQYPRPSIYPQENSDKPRLKYIKIMGYSIRTKRFRYSEWISFNNTIFTKDWNNVYGVELYDHLIDSEESNNLYLANEYQYVRQYLSVLLRWNVDHDYFY